MHNVMSVSPAKGRRHQDCVNQSLSQLNGQYKLNGCGSNFSSTFDRCRMPQGLLMAEGQVNGRLNVAILKMLTSTEVLSIHPNTEAGADQNYRYRGWRLFKSLRIAVAATAACPMA